MSGLLEPGSVFAGDYRIVGPLSSGGMGAIYVVEQLSTRMQRALKLMRAELLADDDARRRFEQEARIAAGIPSEHIVQVQAAGVDTQTHMPYLVMELLEGETLEATIRRRGALPPAEVRQIMGQICHAVGAAHSVGIVHRDLKPSNIFMATAKRTDASFTVKVLDFGIAKLLSERSATTAALGSPLWLAPEQTERSPITPATDVWALGLIAYCLLTGHVFWSSAYSPQVSITEVMREVLIEPIPTAGQRAALAGYQLPAGFDTWFGHCVARDPRTRFINATQAFTSLAQLLEAASASAGAFGGHPGMGGPPAHGGPYGLGGGPGVAAPGFGTPAGGPGTAPATWNAAAGPSGWGSNQTAAASGPQALWGTQGLQDAQGAQAATGPTQGSWGAAAAVHAATPQAQWGTPTNCGVAAGPGPRGLGQGEGLPAAMPTGSGAAAPGAGRASAIPIGCVVGGVLGGAALFLTALAIGYFVWQRSSATESTAAAAKAGAEPSTAAQVDSDVGGGVLPSSSAALVSPSNPNPAAASPSGVSGPNTAATPVPPAPGTVPPVTSTTPTPTPVTTSPTAPTPVATSPTVPPPIVTSTPPSTSAGAQPRARVRTLLGGDRISDFPSDAQSVVRSREPQWKACYLRALGNDLTKHSDETMILWLTMAASGSISRVETRIDSTAPGVGTCVVPIVQAMRFQAPQNPPVPASLIITFAAND